ncbi:hypothetical protein OESDEN_08421 [Oesophagostomum dentatum]|uniref:Uncharacterized protein n=1 Tax=Oesophagostomum dentatum TaxID=61180 RepID=A0A0B1T2F0_OESDE|nr:hypothetical protein OESDEN_08421 [Oesophagostomum dentatum]
MANYRQWIYCVNCTIIIVQILLIGYILKTFSLEWWFLIPTKLTNPIFIFCFVLIGIQFFTCVCGLIGVLISNSYLLSAYWLFMVPLLITDGVMIMPLVEHMSGIHRSIAGHIHEISTEQPYDRCFLNSFPAFMKKDSFRLKQVQLDATYGIQFKLLTIVAHRILFTDTVTLKVGNVAICSFLRQERP